MLRSISISPWGLLLTRLLALLMVTCLAFGTPSSALAQDNSNQIRAPIIDDDFIETACIHIENGDYDGFTALLDRQRMAIEDYYQAINCELFDSPGVSILHTALETNLGLLGFTRRILRDVQRAKETRPNLNTAIFFNQCRNGKSVLDLLIEYKRVSQNNPQILAVLEKVEMQIVGLGALPCPDRFKNTKTTDTGIPF